MIKSELVQKIADKNPHLYHRDIERIVNTVLDEIISAMKDGDRVELRGFGAFSVKSRNARMGRNPRTGDGRRGGGQARALLQDRQGTARAPERPARRMTCSQRILNWTIGLPIAVVAVGFAVANRQWVTVSLRSHSPRPALRLHRHAALGRCSSAASSSASSRAGWPPGSRRANGARPPRRPRIELVRAHTEHERMKREHQSHAVVPVQDGSA